MFWAYSVAQSVIGKVKAEPEQVSTNSHINYFLFLPVQLVIQQMLKIHANMWNSTLCVVPGNNSGSKVLGLIS